MLTGPMLSRPSSSCVGCTGSCILFPSQGCEPVRARACFPSYHPGLGHVAHDGWRFSSYHTLLVALSGADVMEASLWPFQSALALSYLRGSSISIRSAPQR